MNLNPQQILKLQPSFITHNIQSVKLCAYKPVKIQVLVIHAKWSRISQFENSAKKNPHSFKIING